MFVVGSEQRLVKHAQHLVKPVVDLSVKAWYLHNDAFVGKAVDEGVGQSFCHTVLVVVVCFVAHVHYGFLHIAYFVPKYIDGYHWYGIPLLTVVHDVLLALVLNAQILPETQCLRFQPGFLNLYQYQAFAAVVLADSSSKIYTKHRQCIALAVAVFVWAYLHFYDVHL